MNRFLHQAPLIRVALPLILGVIVAILVEWEGIQYYLFTVVLLLLLLIYIYKKQWKYPRNYNRFGLVYSSALFFCGLGLASLHQRSHNEKLKLPTSFSSGHARLVQPLNEGPNSYHGTFELINYWDGKKFCKGGGFSFKLYASKDSLLEKLRPGGELLFRGKFTKHRHSINPHQFDYAAYLERKGIGGSVYVGNNYKILRHVAEGWHLKNTFQILQHKCLEIFRSSGIGEKELGVVSALVLGYKSDLNSETRSEFADAGVVHILAVSGLHVGIIFIVFQWMLRKSLGTRFIYLQFSLILLIIWFYAGVTGFSPSVLRASTMFSFIAFGTAGGKKGNTYNMLSASALLLILIDPLIVREVGFQLSYLAVIGIVFFHDLFKPLFWSRFWFLQKAWELFVVSISAQIATAALSIYYFGQFPNYFFLANLIVIPLATFCLYSGLLYLVLHPIPYLSDILGYTSDWLLSALTGVVSFFSQLPGSVTQNIHFTIYDVIASYTFIVLVLLLRNRPDRLRVMLINLVILFFVMSFAYKGVSSALKSELYILEGKKGSIALLRSGNTGVFTPLYEDSESFSKYENDYYLSDFIRKEGIRNLHWINHHAEIRANYLVNSNMVCFRDVVICYDSGFVLPQNKNKILLLSESFQNKDVDFQSFDLIVMDRKFKDYYKEDVYNQVADSAKVWDMDELDIFKKSYSDFNL